jgi:phospholipid/cholesterol/gamma-HCH transport system substrate-binding protein
VTRRRGATAIASNPVLVGVATTLVIVVAVFLAYNANAGLPWVPTYRLTAEVPAAASLVKGNEVRIGGLRVGVVDKITPTTRPDGTVAAKLDMKLETRIRPLPEDSTLMIRPRSALGLKYVEVTRGTSSKGFPEGGTIPLSHATPKPVEFDEFFNMFDYKTRKGERQNLHGFGDAFAGRGEDLNNAIQAFVPLVQNAVPVLGNIAAPETSFKRFFASQSRAAQIVAPIAAIQGELWANLDLTLAAFADVARPFLQETISKGPKGLQTATETFPRIRPFFRESAKFFHNLQPGAVALRQSAPTLADAFEIGTPVLRDSVGFNQRLGTFLRDLQKFAQDPIVPIGFRDLVNTVSALDPTISFLTPTQTVCNYASLFFRNASSLLSDGDQSGTWLRFMVITTPVGTDGGPAPNGEGAPSAAPANGGGRPISGFDPNYLHANPYPNTAAPGEDRECEAGNEPYARAKQAIGNVPGNQGTVTEDQPKKKKK